MRIYPAGNTESGPTPLIALHDVKKRYGRNEALTVDELEIFAGDRILLSGNNGSGKSTLLRVLSGVATRSRGRMERQQEPQIRVAFVPQVGGMMPDMSVSNNLADRMLLYGIRDSTRVEAWLERTGLGAMREKRFGHLSGGFQRLAALTAALCVEPAWLFLDEPFTGVDERLRQEVERILEEALPTLQLLVIASPELADTPPFINRVVSLKEGRIDGIDGSSSPVVA